MLRAVGGAAQVLQARDEVEYEEYAVRLLTNPRKWRQVYDAVVRSRGMMGEREVTSVLWTPLRWVRDVEKALLLAWHWHLAALADDPLLARGGAEEWGWQDSGTGRRAGDTKRDTSDTKRSSSRSAEEVRWCRGDDGHKQMGGGPWKCQRHYGHIVVAQTPDENLPRATPQGCKASQACKAPEGSASGNMAEEHKETWSQRHADGAQPKRKSFEADAASAKMVAAPSGSGSGVKVRWGHMGGQVGGGRGQAPAFARGQGSKGSDEAQQPPSSKAPAETQGAQDARGKRPVETQATRDMSRHALRQRDDTAEEAAKEGGLTGGGQQEALALDRTQVLDSEKMSGGWWPFN
jgi:hypothetical protein